MKILHTADWHLGQTFFTYDRREEHEAFLEWLREQVRHVEADVLLISGDVFDTPNPSAVSQQLFYRFLRQITEENRALLVVVIAGNHDSAARLEAPNPLLEDMRITIRGIIRRNAEGEIDLDRLIVPLGNAREPEAYCLAVPYLRQGDYPPAENYAQGVYMLYEMLLQRVSGYGKPIVAMGHLQATGAEISEYDRSERTIIGGLECVSPDAFAAGICYTALGHLHRSQRVSGRDNVRYAGAPIPMSFAEKNNRHGVVCITLDKAECHIELLPFVPPVALLSVGGDVEEVFAAIDRLPQGSSDRLSPYLEVRVRLSQPEPSLRQRIEGALQGKYVRLARLVAEFPGSANERVGASVDNLQEVSPMQIAQDCFERKYGGKMSDEMAVLLQQVMKEVQV